MGDLLRSFMSFCRNFMTMDADDRGGTGRAMPASPGRSQVVAVCPDCRGQLLWTQGGISCSQCGQSYRRLCGGGGDFLGGITHAHTEIQRAIYDGDADGGIRLTYRDRDQHRMRTEEVFDTAARTGFACTSMREVMDTFMLRRAGLSRGMEVLDIGAGGGLLLNTLAAVHGVRGTGVDISEFALSRAAEYNPMELSLHLADACRLPFADGAFDRVVSFDVLEHLPDQRGALREAARCVRPGGQLLFYAVSARDDYTWHWAQRRATGGRVGTDDAGGHVRALFLDPAETASWLRAVGFSAIEVVPFHAFATLMIDERLQNVTRALARHPRLFRAFFRLARAADGPWEAAGLGNGFYLFGTREKAPP